MTTSTQRTHDRSDRPKTVLFCPECTYESPIADNWFEATSDGTRLSVCPVCGTVVDRRATAHPRAPAEAD
ncbi:MAG: hypothetical protein ACQETB_04505 [Halobacteriota archaeon]